ncbi:MAG TPA: glycosyltransferase family 2 protein [Mycobacteriales bacterium]|nr:glycosyltransferase family 2 protein [Mycobacteriales bacterium]
MSGTNRKERPYIASVRAQALADFQTANPTLKLAPAVAVIAALNERESIGAVLDLMPPEACGVGVDVLVIDDGSTDGTSAVVLDNYPGVHVVRLERNCGHGVALRLGYQVAAQFGAQFILTLDADLQWDPREIPQVLEPLVTDQADFVIGSRVLGTAETDDAIRHVGVTFFAKLISLLTHTHVTDTSSGFRAMRVEVTQQVPQVQVQYQTSELLIGAIYHGFRIAERPITMHKRHAGESKKGHNLLYGGRYCKVILQTWLRESRRARRAKSGVAVTEPA